MPYPFIPAKNFNHGGMLPIRLIVIHTMESPEGVNTARNVASWFEGSTAPQASAHYCIDAKEIIQCVKETDRAWHAGPVNPYAIGIEHAGMAGQTPEQWADEYSLAELKLSAALVADLCKRYDIPVVWLSPECLKNGHKGITGHKQVSDAFGGTHWDPGPNFPVDQYLAWVEEAMAPDTQPAA